MFEETNIRKSKKYKFHLVLISDETGIFDAFKIIKEHLGRRDEKFLSLIYSVPENYLNPLFEREIAILEKRFSHNLYTYTLKVEPGKYGIIQESIEPIINSNPNLKMQFLVFGNEEFVDYVSGILGYLNVDTFSIEPNIILNH
ncbi:MAG: hypothetical protein V1903_03760 [Bacteroidota bacterium]